MSHDTTTPPTMPSPHQGRRVGLSGALDSGVVIASEILLGQVLGMGGFAITYSGRDQTLNLPVAVKEYYPATIARRFDDGTVGPVSESSRDEFDHNKTLFAREAQHLAKFKHKNIVSVFRVVHAMGTVYTIMELIEGEDLEDWIRGREGAPSQEQLDLIVAPLIEALEQVHAAGVLHRDIKPQNIRIRKSDREPVLIDFGAADIYATSNSSTLASGITVGFAPIETYQADFSQQGPWTDIYGMAATVYRALTGSPPAQAPARVVEDTYRPLAGRAEFAAYRQDFLRATDWGLALRPKERPRSLGEWQDQVLPQSTRFKVQQRRQVRGTKLFISYRRGDTAHAAGRIYDRLTATFGDDMVFFDVDAIPIGVDFRAHIERSIQQSAVLVVVIGRQWLREAAGGGGWLSFRRPSTDYVMIELELAVEHGLTILPLLVDGADMPAVTQLPKALRDIAFINATPIRAGKDFRKDMDQVQDRIRTICAGL